MPYGYLKYAMHVIMYVSVNNALQIYILEGEKMPPFYV